MLNTILIQQFEEEFDKIYIHRVPYSLLVNSSRASTCKSQFNTKTIDLYKEV